MGTAWQNLRLTHERFGIAAVCKLVLHAAINRLVTFNRLHIIVLDRDRLQAVEPGAGRQFTTRRATLDDFEGMRKDPSWQITDKLMKQFAGGDVCMLSFVDGELAGYTWAHELGQPELMLGLSITVPRDYLYNYGGLTLPRFRGSGLQGFRHRLVLAQPEWADRKGLLGFVMYTNFASQKGQGKSGYRKVGTLWLLGKGDSMVSWRSGALRRLGIERIRPKPAAQIAGPGPVR